MASLPVASLLEIGISGNRNLDRYTAGATLANSFWGGFQMLFLAFKPLLLIYIFAKFLYRQLLWRSDSGWFTSIPKWLRNEIGMTHPVYFFWQEMLSVLQIQRVRNDWRIGTEMLLLFGELYLVE